MWLCIKHKSRISCDCVFRTPALSLNIYFLISARLSFLIAPIVISAAHRFLVCSGHIRLAKVLPLISRAHQTCLF
jgi:hypothetical protein